MGLKRSNTLNQNRSRSVQEKSLSSFKINPRPIKKKIQIKSQISTKKIAQLKSKGQECEDKIIHMKKVI